MRVEAFGRAVVITVGPTLLARDVGELERKLRLLAPVELLTVDLARARDLDDCVVARLAEALRRITPCVEFRGLSLHQRRLLRYLGQGTPEPPPWPRSPSAMIATQSDARHGRIS